MTDDARELRRQASYVLIASALLALVSTCGAYVSVFGPGFATWQPAPAPPGCPLCSWPAPLVIGPPTAPLAIPTAPVVMVETGFAAWQPPAPLAPPPLTIATCAGAGCPLCSPWPPLLPPAAPVPAWGVDDVRVPRTWGELADLGIYPPEDR